MTVKLNIYINGEYAAKNNSYDITRILSLYPQALLAEVTCSRMYLEVEHWKDVADLTQALRLWNTEEFK